MLFRERHLEGGLERIEEIFFQGEIDFHPNDSWTRAAVFILR
jgi:hypothetical protein